MYKLSYYINMLDDPNTLHKLIILYMLNKTQFMMTHTQLKDIFLSKEWMSYFSFQMSSPNL